MLELEVRAVGCYWTLAPLCTLAKCVAEQTYVYIEKHSNMAKTYKGFSISWLYNNIHQSQGMFWVSCAVSVVHHNLGVLEYKLKEPDFCAAAGRWRGVVWKNGMQSSELCMYTTFLSPCKNVFFYQIWAAYADTFLHHMGALCLPLLLFSFAMERLAHLTRVATSPPRSTQGTPITGVNQIMEKVDFYSRHFCFWQL